MAMTDETTQPPDQLQAGKKYKSRSKYVAVACVPCRRSKVRCDHQRPCGYCIKRNIEHSCVDGVNRIRKRSISDVSEEEEEEPTTSKLGPILDNRDSEQLAKIRRRNLSQVEMYRRTPLVVEPYPYEHGVALARFGYKHFSPIRLHQVMTKRTAVYKYFLCLSEVFLMKEHLDGLRKDIEANAHFVCSGTEVSTVTRIHQHHLVQIQTSPVLLFSSRFELTAFEYSVVQNVYGEQYSDSEVKIGKINYHVKGDRMVFDITSNDPSIIEEWEREATRLYLGRRTLGEWRWSVLNVFGLYLEDWSFLQHFLTVTFGSESNNSASFFARCRDQDNNVRKCHVTVSISSEDPQVDCAFMTAFKILD